MSEATIGTDGWDSVVTTTAETVFQNKGNVPIYITTEATGSLAFDQGYYLEPNGGSIILDTGVTVSAVAHRYDTELFYMQVQ